MIEITSLQNPKVKHLIALRDRRERDSSGEFLIEGYRELLRAVDAGWRMTQLFFCPELFLGVNEQALIDRIERYGAQLFRCTKQVFEKLSYRDRPDGLVAVSTQKTTPLNQLKQEFLLVAEAIEKPGNLGTILRTADAVGVDGLILADKCTDLFNPNVVRASVGTLFSVPIADATGDEAIQWLKSNNIKILAATPHATEDYTDVDLTVPLAIVLGTEQLGLSQKWMEQADLQVKIPMLGIADSLNVSTASSILMYEALRQRRLKKHG